MDGILQYIVLYYYNFNIWRYGFWFFFRPFNRRANRQVTG